MGGTAAGIGWLPRVRHRGRRHRGRRRERAARGARGPGMLRGRLLGRPGADESDRGVVHALRVDADPLQGPQRTRQVLGQRGLHLHPVPRGVPEADAPRVQERARAPHEVGRRLPPVVLAVPDDRVPDRAHVDADLVRPPGDDHDAAEREYLVAASEPVVAQDRVDRLRPLPRVGDVRDVVVLVPRDGGVDLGGHLPHRAVDQADVLLEDFVHREGRPQVDEAGLGLPEHEGAGGVDIEAVRDAELVGEAVRQLILLVVLELLDEEVA
mmetsp:Transcript_118578/g.336170  ORF Transcript_118578/g.336170 Transcript_118578/m.336170 type:complete len:268 (+) Transcript_118578:1439-2242(+)